MDSKEAENLEKRLYRLFRKKFTDLKTKVDFSEDSHLLLSFCWDRYSFERWKNEKTFTLCPKNYQRQIDEKIIPYFEKLGDDNNLLMH